MRRPVALYISYDGMLEPPGQSQVIACLECLAMDKKWLVIARQQLEFLQPALKPSLQTMPRFLNMYAG